MTGHDPESHATSLDPHMKFFMMQFNIILPFMSRPHAWFVNLNILTKIQYSLLYSEMCMKYVSNVSF